MGVNLSCTFFFLLVTGLSAIAQTKDTLQPPMRPKGFFNRWQAAGISLIAGTPIGRQDGQFPMLFERTVQGKGRTKYDYDKATTQGYANNFTKIEYNYAEQISIRFTIKPRNPDRHRFISYQEISAGIGYNYQSGSVRMVGDSIYNDSLYRGFQTYYDFVQNNILLDILYTIQTPGFFGFLSFYSGPGLYAGVPVKSNISSTPSYTYTAVLPATSLNTTETLAAHENFAKPTGVAGVYVPIGVKFNLSPRSNLFLEYTFNRQTNFFTTGYAHSQWYRGTLLGYRFKFGAKQRIKDGKDEENEPSRQPAPFY